MVGWLVGWLAGGRAGWWTGGQAGEPDFYDYRNFFSIEEKQALVTKSWVQLRCFFGVEFYIKTQDLARELHAFGMHFYPKP